MHIHRLTAFHVPMALKRTVKHASHVRTANDTLVVKCVMSDGSVGWGEGLPRTYVTGDSIDSAWRHLEATSFDELRSRGFSSALEVALTLDQLPLAEVPPDTGVTVRECFGNSVRCAVELAVLDAACRTEGCSLGELIRQLPDTAGVLLEQPAESVRYSGAITSESPARQWLSALKMKAFGFAQIKIKLGTHGVDDAALLNRVRRVVGRRVDLRGDANEAWHCDELVARIAALERFTLSCLEQPVPHAEVSGLAHVRREIGVPIMLDESLCCLEDAQRAIAGNWSDLFNIRLSKCGGLVRSVRIAALAKRFGLGFQLGCQVGETGILSAAGRHFACQIAGLRYLEGSFDHFLVRDRLTEQDLTFRYAGLAPRLPGPGLGVTIDECRVRSLAVRMLDVITP